MRRHAVIRTGVAILFTGALVWAGQGTSDDAKALDDYLAGWTAAYNAHDAKALAALLAEEFDVVFTTGERVQGQRRADYEKGAAEYFAKNPKVKTKLSVISRRFLKPDVVV